MDFEPNWQYFKDDNWQRAQEITSPRPINNPLRLEKKNYTPQEKKEILARVREIGVLKTAIEYGMNKRIIRNWLRDMDNTSQKNSPLNERSTTAMKINNAPDVKQEAPETLHAPAETDTQELHSEPQRIRKAKDFTPEEKALIIQRINEVGGKQAAREFSTSYNVIRHIKAQAALTEQDKTIIANFKKSQDFTLDEKAAIIARALETSFRKAAEEAHISLSTINYWCYKQKIQPAHSTNVTEQNTQYVIDLPETIQAPEKVTSDAPVSETREAVTADNEENAMQYHDVKENAPNVQPIINQVPLDNFMEKASNQSMEFENSILKEKVKDLSSQIDKLKSVIKTLLD